MRKVIPSSVIVYRPFGASLDNSVSLPDSTKMFVPNDEQHNEVLEGEQKSQISKNRLRKLLFTFIGYGDGSLKLFLTIKHRTDLPIDNNKVKIFKFTELLKGLSSIDGMMVLENISSRHHKKKQMNNSFTHAQNSSEESTCSSIMMTIHSFTLIVISKFKKSIQTFRMTLNYDHSKSILNTIDSNCSDFLIGNTSIEIVPDTTLLPTKSIVGLDVFTITTTIKKKGVEKYLVAITTDNHVWIWHEKNLEKHLACLPLPEISSSEIVIDFSIQSRHDGSNLLCILTSRQSLLFFDLKKTDIGITNSFQLEKSIAIDENHMQQIQDTPISSIHAVNNLILTHFKNKLAHVISFDKSHHRIENIYELDLADVALLHFTNHENFIFYDNNNRKLMQCMNGIQKCLMEKIQSHENEYKLSIFTVTKDGSFIMAIIGSYLLVLRNVMNGEETQIILACDILNEHNDYLIHHVTIGNPEKNKFISITPANLLSRLLYTNPVCLLTSSFNNQRNIMTITWLTPVDNSGHFVCSMNTARHSASLVLPSMKFALNVPTIELENTVLAVGGCSGRAVDKFAKFVNCEEDASDEENHSQRKPLSLITYNIENHGSFYCFLECCAHMCCVVEKELERICPNHHLFYCIVVAGFVKQGYWKDGKMFISNNEFVCPPYLTFVGSQQFAKVSSLNDGL
nr:unnamed protein product [Naegleria fowleri]